MGSHLTTCPWCCVSSSAVATSCSGARLELRPKATSCTYSTRTSMVRSEPCCVQGSSSAAASALPRPARACRHSMALWRCVCSAALAATSAQRPHAAGPAGGGRHGLCARAAGPGSSVAAAAGAGGSGAAATPGGHGKEQRRHAAKVGMLFWQAEDGRRGMHERRSPSLVMALEPLQSHVSFCSQ